MSKLGDLTGSNKQDTKAINNALNNLIGENSYTTVDLTKIPLNEICPRYKNYFIDDTKSFKALRNDIEENGLQQPLVVVNIKEYLNKDIQKNEREYLSEQLSKNIKYFISSGHRRYKAYVSLYENKIDVPDVENVYKNFGAPEFDEKYSEITCKILKNESNEANVYKGTNLTSRPVTNFEFVISYFNDHKTNEIERGYLNKIHDYIYEKYGNSISVSTISDYVKIFTSYPKELLECIFTGELSLRQAQKLLPVLEVALKDENLIKKIKTGKFKVDDYKEKKQKYKKVMYTESQILEILNKIKRNPKYIDEAIEKFSSK